MPAAALLVLAGALDGPAPTTSRAAALAIDYAGVNYGGIMLRGIVRRRLIELHAHPRVVPASALCGGVALQLPALSPFKRRDIGTFNEQRLLTASLLGVMIPPATAIPVLLALGLVTALACGLIAVEVRRRAETRQRVRHPQAHRGTAGVCFR